MNYLLIKLFGYFGILTIQNPRLSACKSTNDNVCAFLKVDLGKGVTFEEERTIDERRLKWQCAPAPNTDTLRYSERADGWVF